MSQKRRRRMSKKKLSKEEIKDLKRENSEEKVVGKLFIKIFKIIFSFSYFIF